MGYLQIPCQCGITDIGQNRHERKLDMKEYEGYVKYQHIKSSISQYLWTCNHPFNFF